MDRAHWDGLRFYVDGLTEKQLKDAYPFYHVEMQKMTAWYMANPKSRKKNHMRFIVNWLNKTAKDHKIDPKAARDYSMDNNDLKEKTEKYVAAPPPAAWNELKAKLKEGRA